MSVVSKSVLPETLRSKLHLLGARLEQQLPINREFDGVLDEINALPPGIIVRAEAEIAFVANLQKWRRRFPLVVRLFSRAELPRRCSAINHHLCENGRRSYSMIANKAVHDEMTSVIA